MESGTFDSPAIERDLRAVTTAPRLFRVRLWLISQLWVSVLTLNLVAVTLSYFLPKIDNVIHAHSPLLVSTVQSIFTALAEKLRIAMQTLKEMIFGRRSERLAVLVADQFALEGRIGLELDSHGATSRSPSGATTTSASRLSASGGCWSACRSSAAAGSSPSRTATAEDIALRLVRGATVGHDHDHRHHLAVGNQVVEDAVGGAELRPVSFVAADPMQQIEHGVFAVGRIPWRRVDHRRTAGIGDPRGILDSLDSPGLDAWAAGIEAVRRVRECRCLSAERHACKKRDDG